MYLTKDYDITLKKDLNTLPAHVLCMKKQNAKPYFSENL